jgi:MurE/MurF fusion protein
MIIGNFIKGKELKYKKHYFSGLCFDSSKCKKHNIFFAIKGTKINGNKFINQAIKKGAQIIISEKKFEGIKNKILFIKSSNVRKSLAEIAYKIYKEKPKNIIAITGTNGKSSVADFYFQILKFNKKKVASIGTLGVKTQNYIKKISNTTIDPINLSKILCKLKKEKINNVIMEASSHGLKQNRLDGLKFNTGIFTNLSHDHLDYHKTFSDYLKSKLYLFRKLLIKNANIITDINIPEFKKIKKIASEGKLNIETISNVNSNLEMISHQYHKEKQIVKLKYHKKIYEFETKLIGKIQIKNILMAIIAAKKSGLNFKKIINAINSLKPVNGRLQQVGIIKNNSKVILDYAHTPKALETSLKSLKEQFKNRKISIVFGCGGDRDKAKRPMMGKIANQYCNVVYVTDDNPRHENPRLIRNSIKKNIKKSKIYEISDRAKAIKKAIVDLKTGDILIIAGKGHEKVQEFNNTKKLFSDEAQILRNIRIKNKTLSNNIKLNILKELSNSKKISSKLKIESASINSKQIKKNSVFFAIKGKNKNGNLFVKEAFRRGACLAIVNNQKKSNKKIIVKDTLNFLTKASSVLRENLSGKIISITGSCGKTSLKEFTVRSLKKISQVSYSPKSYNNKFGVPLSLFNSKINDDFGIFEIGMDKKGEIDNLSKIIRPDVGVITNISYAHIKNFKSINQIALAKAEIIQNINDEGYLVLNLDDRFYNFHKNLGLKNNLKIISFSLKNKSATVNLNSISKEKSKYKINININKKKKYFFFNSLFENDLKNLLATISIISIYKDINKIDKNIFNDYKVTNGRGDITKVKLFKKSFYLVDESYNSNPLSLKSALMNFDKIKVYNSKKHLILGDMLELGRYSKKLHAEIGKNINKTSLRNVNVIGKHIKLTFNNLDKNKRGLVLENRYQIIDLIKNNLNNNDYLMIKGSNSTGLNSLVNKIKTGKINAL